LLLHQILQSRGRNGWFAIREYRLTGSRSIPSSRAIGRRDRPLAIFGKAIQEEALGPEHPDVAISLDNLAELYRTQYQYAKAEPLHQRALAIREKAVGPGHPHVAFSLDNLAGLYRAQGQYTKAESLHQRALAIFEKALGPEHPDVATSLNNLALLYRT
jgi:tetratricopeptide (TPR) repeat protein